MKKLLLILVMMAVPSLTLAQVFIEEDFSGTFPPTGWAADSHSSNWHDDDSENAGGSSPELVFDWDPQFNGMSRFMSPRVDLTGITELKVQFRHMLDHYSTPYTIGVATRHGTNAWNIVWSRVNPSGNISPTVVNIDVNNSDVGTSDFQIAWYFSGNSYNVDYWYIDDILVYSPLLHDVKVASIDIQNQYEPGLGLIPAASIENFGLSIETCDVTFNIDMNGGNIYSNTVTGVSLDPGEVSQVNFATFNIPTADEIYDVTVFTTLSGDLNPSNDTTNAVFNTYTTDRDMVILEIGTGTWCQYCPGAAMGAEDLIDNGHNVGVAEYHNGDNFVTPSGTQRIDYYGITGFPTAVFDGVIKYVGGSNNQSMYPNYLPIYQERSRIKSAFSIEIFGDNTGNDYSLMVRVTKNARIRYENMVLHLALTESGIAYNWQGQNHLSFVERLMSPSADGTPLSFTSGDIQEIPLEFTLGTTWDVAECELVAFVQNLDGKEILQGTKVMLTELMPVGVDDNVNLPTETKLHGNYPNPFNPSTTIELSLRESGNTTLEVFNVLGQKVRTLVNGPMQAGNHSVIWDGRDAIGSDVSSGVYFYRLTAGNYEQTKKMVLTK